jgi:glycogen debranching enzyme
VKTHELLEGIARLKPQAQAAMESLQTTLHDRGKRFLLYNAGSSAGRVHFGLFPRDLLTTALMLRNVDLLRETVRFSVHTIGQRRDATTGEEPGRVLHEWNKAERDGLLSRYNATETSQLLLIAAAELLKLQAKQSRPFPPSVRSGLVAAGEYVLTHIQDGLFLEDPAYCGASRYFAHATYWKDSHLPGRESLDYPVAYTLVQAQTVAALRSLAALAALLRFKWQKGSLCSVADELARAISSRLWDLHLRGSLIALDRETPIGGISSDALHMLAYLEPRDLPPVCVEAIRTAAAALATPYGYRSYAPNQVDYAPDAYHLGSIWPYEQVFIARGARRFGLTDVFATSTRILSALDRLAFPELVTWDGKHLLGGGCDVQLWTCAVPAVFETLLDHHSIPTALGGNEEE